MQVSEIIPTGSLTFGGNITGLNQFLVPNGPANGPPLPLSGSSSAKATVPVPSYVYAAAWNFERNVYHEFRLILNTKNGSYLRWMDFLGPSGVIQYPEPHNVFRLDEADTLQISSTSTQGTPAFPGNITVTLYLARLVNPLVS